MAFDVETTNRLQFLKQLFSGYKRSRWYITEAEITFDANSPVCTDFLHGFFHVLTSLSSFFSHLTNHRSVMSFRFFYIDLYTFKHAHSQNKTHFASGSCLEFYALYHGCFWWLSKMIVLNYWQPPGNCLHPPIYFLPFLLFSHNSYVRIYQIEI